MRTLLQRPRLPLDLLTQLRLRKFPMHGRAHPERRPARVQRFLLHIRGRARAAGFSASAGPARWPNRAGPAHRIPVYTPTSASGMPPALARALAPGSYRTLR